jgi:hypothetical protein
MRVVSMVCFGVLAAGAGCGGGEIDMGDDHGPGETCEDPGYGDGTCDVDLACEAPDIDCYVLFADHAEAQSWFAGIEEQIAASQFREPRALLPESDEHHVRMRALLDEGWEAYMQVNAVGDLAERALELVVVEDPSINAFVQGDGEKAGFAVMVHTGIIDAASDEELVSIVMHELTHAIYLHVIPGEKDRVRIHYLAAEGEPFGFEQPDDAMVRSAMTDWRALATDVGPLQTAPLAGFPLSIGNGTLYRTFKYVTDVWAEAHPDVCAAPMANLAQLTNDIFTYYSRIDQTLHVGGVEENLYNAQNSALVALRDQCMAGLADSYITILADINGKTEEEIRDMLDDADEALVDGKHFIAAIATLINDRRVKMRAIETEFQTATGVAWNRVRQYTFEEEADDSTIPVLTRMERDPAGIGPGLLLLDDEATQGECNALLAGETSPPYGADLQDEHHANCWRVWHVRALADSGRLTDGSSALRRQAPAAPARPARYRPLPYPKSLADYTVY